MSDGMKRLEEDQQDYLELCERMGVRPRFKASGQPDCYGAHAAELQAKAQGGSYPVASPNAGPSTSAGHLKDFLSGYVRTNPLGLDALRMLKASQWHRLAEAELARRNGIVLEILPTELLADIAAGRIDAVAVVQGLQEARHGK